MRRIFAILTLFVAVTMGGGGCNDNPVAPGDPRSVSGTWDGRFEGIVQGAGTRQTDTFVLELNQSRLTVTGTLRFSGLELAIPVTGQIEGSVFTYTARAALGPACEGVVTAQTTLNTAGTQLTGSQTQSTCEGTAIGQMNATRR